MSPASAHAFATGNPLQQAVAPAASERRSCDKCYRETDQAVAKCPQCGGRLRTAGQIRALGVVLLFVGVFLVALMGAVTIFVIGVVSQAESSKLTANDTPTFLAIFALFGLVIMFGFTSIAGGLWQIVFGKRNKALKYIILALAFALLLIGSVVQLIL